MPSYSINLGSAKHHVNEFNEGNILFTSVDTTGLNSGTLRYWTFSGNEINDSDFSYGILPTNSKWALIRNTSNIKVSQTIAADQSSKENETFYQRLYLNKAHTIQVGETVPVMMKNSSKRQTATYSISTFAANTLNEGERLTTTVKVTNATQGTNHYLDTYGNDLSTDDFTSSSPVNGSSTVRSDTKFTYSQTLKNNSSTRGYESYTSRLFTDS